MIPYFEIQTFHVGLLTIHTWGFVVSIGIAVAIFVAYRRCQSLALTDSTKLSFKCGVILDLAFWIILAAFLGARLFHVFFYEWEYYRVHLSEIIRIYQGGLSSFGGFIGAVVAFALLSRRYKLDVWRYADLLMFAWPLGHGIGRLGCFLTHMHPGQLSKAPWAVAYPGGARLDMGLIEAGYHFLMFGVLLLLSRKPRRTGFYVMLTMVTYGIARLVFDFFRATDLSMSDARYWGLTPAQYGSLVLLAVGIYFYARCRTIRTVA